MVLKYDFNITNTNNIFMDGLAYANDNSGGLLIYSIVLLIMGISLYVFIRKTDDVELSAVRSLFIGSFISVIFYYSGKNLGVSFFSGVILISELILLSASIGLLYYSRNETGGS